MKYYPLHCHSHYSLLDGLSKCEDIAARIEELELDGCALTDHGTLSGTVDFFKKMTKAKLKPILGCELYICRQQSTIKKSENKKCDHQVVLAKNMEGWRDLLRLIGAANNPNTFYHKPRIDYSTLAKNTHGNFVSFSGHLGSTLGNVIIKDNSLDPDWKKLATQKAFELQSIFGKDNFYLEVQMIDAKHNPQAKILGEAIRELSKLIGIPCVATPDAHYATHKDAENQRVLLSIAMRKTLKEIDMAIKQGENVGFSSFFKSDNYHIPSYEEMTQVHTEEELDNTLKIADMCKDYNILHSPLLPQFKCPTGQHPDQYLQYLCAQGRDKLINSEDKPKYNKRLDYELGVLRTAGLASYFLIVKDICDYVRSQGWLVGPGRGSAAGSLASYFLGITSIDPLPYGLIFERFYNAGRNTADNISMPDIDVDVQKNARTEVLKYVRKKYGQDSVAAICTFQSVKGRAALKRVLHSYGDISFEQQNFITNQITDENKITDELEHMKKETGEASIIKWSLENKPDKFKDWCTLNDDGTLDGPLAHTFKQAMALEGTKIIASQHPGGIVITPMKLNEVAPMFLNKERTELIVAIEKQECEDVGLLKLDILGVNMLTKMQGISSILSTGDVYV